MANLSKAVTTAELTGTSIFVMLLGLPMRLLRIVLGSIRNILFWPFSDGAFYAKVHGIQTPGIDKFPEMMESSFSKKPKKIGLAVSGGGSRAHVLASSVFRFFEEKGFMEKVGYQSSVSGGSWASSIYAYTKKRDNLLGKTALDNLNSLTLAGLREADPGTLALAVETENFKVYDAAWNLTIRGTPLNELWQEFIGLKLLKPFELEDSLIALNDDHVKQIKAMNLQHNGISRAKFATLDGRPFLIIGCTLGGPEGYTPGTGNSFQVTPLYSGVPYYKNSQKMGFFTARAINWVMPHVFGTPFRKCKLLTIGGGVIDTYALGSPGTSFRADQFPEFTFDEKNPVVTLGGASHSGGQAPREIPDVENQKETTSDVHEENERFGTVQKLTRGFLDAIPHAWQLFRECISGRKRYKSSSEGSKYIKFYGHVNDKLYRLKHAVGASSAAFVAEFQMYNLGCSLTPQLKYFAMFSKRYMQFSRYHPPVDLALGDGGNLENIGLMALLQRRLPKIVCMISTPVPLDLNFTRNIFTQYNLRENKTTYKCATTDFLAYFGCVEFFSVGSNYTSATVFPRSALNDVMEDFIAGVRNGTGAVSRRTLTTLPNRNWGIVGGDKVDIIFIYNSEATNFVQSLPEETQEEIKKGQLPGKKRSGKFKNFPHFKTTFQNQGEPFSLSREQINLLGANNQYILEANKEMFHDFFSS